MKHADATSTELRTEITRLGPWFHNLHLPGGVQTAPDHPLGDFPRVKWEQLADAIPQDLRGWRVLDIGCNAGFYTFQLVARGADVLGIDVDERYLRQARWAAGRLGLERQVEFRQMQVYDLVEVDRTFDLVLFMGVFYHLRHPLLGLDVVRERVGRLLVFQSATIDRGPPADVPHDLSLDEREALAQRGWPSMAFVEHRLAGDPTNWWLPDEACVLAMLRSVGLRVIARPGHEICVCEPAPEIATADAGLVHAELAAATGIDRRRT